MNVGGSRSGGGRPALSGRTVGIDLGTTNSLVYVRGRGIVVDVPSVVALEPRSGTTRAVGHEAERMLGRTPAALTALRPLRDGVIHDLAATAALLRHLLRSIGTRRHRAVGPRVVLCVPADVTGVERRGVEQATLDAGARAVSFIEEPLAAAIGAGLPIGEPHASMVVDVGGGTTEAAVIALGGMVTRTTARIGGDDLDAAIKTHLKKHLRLLVGDRTAESLKLSLGTAAPVERVGDEPPAGPRPSARAGGRDVRSGLPTEVVVAADLVRAAIAEPVRAIVDVVRQTLDGTPPELAADMVDRGLVLTGGGALLHGLDDLLAQETGMPVVIADAPLTSVASGAGQCLEHVDVLEQVVAGVAGG